MTNAAIDTTATVTSEPSVKLVALDPTEVIVFSKARAEIAVWATRAEAINVTSEDDVGGMKLARESRLAIRKFRIAVDHEHESLKADVLKRGRAIDAARNEIVDLIKPIEDKLRFHEEFGARVAASRKDALRTARADCLRALGADPAVYADLGALAEDQWETTHQAAKDAYEAKLEQARQAEAIRIEAERIAIERREQEKQARFKLEAERVAEAARVAEENARLRAEAEEREAAAKVERERVEAERAAERTKAKADADARNEAFRAEQAERDRVAQEERIAAQRQKELDDFQTGLIRQEEAKARAALEAEAEKSRKEAEAAARELAAAKATTERQARERAEAEATRIAEEVAAKEAAALAPDREKFAALAETLRTMDVLPHLTTQKGRAARAKVCEQMLKMISWIEKVGVGL